MLVTINTDASLVNEFGGYAFWIVCDQGKIQKAGKLKQKSKSSTDFELMGIANAIYTLRHSKFGPISKVIINTDSKTSIGYLTRQSSPRKMELNSIVEETYFNMLDICLKNGKSIREVKNFIEFRHVKAHSGIKDKRSYVNEWCDKEAKKYARLNNKQNS